MALFLGFSILSLSSFHFFLFFPLGIDTSSLDNTAADDDIDAALSELQLTLGGGTNGHSKTSDITHIPELTDYLRFLKYEFSSIIFKSSVLLTKLKFQFQTEKIHSQRIQTLLVRVQGFVFVFI